MKELFRAFSYKKSRKPLKTKAFGVVGWRPRENLNLRPPRLPLKVSLTTYSSIEGVGDKSYGYKGLEDPFEEDPCFKVGKVIVVNDHLNQLIASDKG